MRGEEDRFGDLSADGDRRGAGEGAAERLAERDLTHPEPLGHPPGPPRPASRYAWAVGLLMLMGVSVLLLTTALPNTGKGVRGPRPGERLPVFAAPLATGGLDGDANVRQGARGSRAAGKVPACQVHSPRVVNLCELRRRPLVLTFVVTKGADCEPQVDRVERMRRGFPGVNFAVVLSGNEQGGAEQIARRRRWTEPVAVDRDGAVVNLYRIGICPTTVFALPGGRVLETALGNLTEGELRAKVGRLVRSAGRR